MDSQPTEARDATEAAPTDLEVVRAYHERTKHHFHRHAASLGFLDWATQPNPFRRYAGCDEVRLPLPAEGRTLPYDRLFEPRGVPAAALSVESISLFFRYALSLTAWKSFQGSTWALRANPSSGNLHPTEGYALLPAIQGLGHGAAVYHYAPREHTLELRASIDASVWRSLLANGPQDTFLVGLSSIHWREAWKYGERAFRYCQHDVGHALGALWFAAAAQGWNLQLLGGESDLVIARLLGLNRAADYGEAEREHPDLLAIVTTKELQPHGVGRLPEDSVQAVAVGVWRGVANVLSPHHGVDWPVIDEVARAASNHGMNFDEEYIHTTPKAELSDSAFQSESTAAEKVILGRRSAVSMDATTHLPADVFFHMLGRLMPKQAPRMLPWNALPWRARIHLGLFVHRVDGLSPGLYALVRDPARTDAFRKALRPDFIWRRPEGCPAGLPLFLLAEGDCRALAARVSCGQDIAGDGAFSLGMIADYSESLATHGPAFYRHLFWEAGLVGQVLYLEAEAAGTRATGIGCYFDDPVHTLFGIGTSDWQSLYHFTVGGAVDDSRLTTLPAYPTQGLPENHR